MIQLIKKEIKKNSCTKEYNGYGYTIQVNDTRKFPSDSIVKLTIKVIPDYKEIMVYPNIEFRPLSKQFQGNFTGVMKVSLEDKELWEKGMNNLFSFLQEANQMIEEFIKYEL